MMQAYLDKENLISMFKQRSQSIIINDGIRMLKLNFDLFFNFTKEEAQLDTDLKLIIAQFTQGVGNQIKANPFSHSILERPLSNTIHKNLGNHVVLFVNEDVSEINKIGGLLACSVGGEEIIFNKLFLYANGNGYNRKMSIGKMFKSWDDILPFALPFTDILVIDQFLFSEYERAKLNLAQFFSKLHFNKKLKTNIVFFIKNGEIEPGKDLKDFLSIVKDSIKNEIGTGPNITVIQVRDIKDKKSWAEHDRTIVMNYIRIYSGDCVSNYFNQDGSKRTKGRDIDFSSHANNEYFDLTMDLFADMQRAISWYEINNPDAIQGDKISNFIKFAD